MDVKRFCERVESGELSNQSQVWNADQLSPAVRWIRLAAKILEAVRSGLEADTGDRMDIRDLLDEVNHG